MATNDQPTLPLPSGSTLPTRVHALVASAACATQTQASLLALHREAELRVVCTEGKPGPMLEVATQLLPTLPGNELYVHSISAAERQAELAFLATVPVEQQGKCVGLLAVLSSTPHRLSGAQEYVLRTLATEIADQLELDTLRRDLAQAQSRRSINEERLRLLESVVVNANDAVLITEAEPVDLPGPKIVYANAAFTRTTGYSLEDVLGQTPRILQGPGTDDHARKRLKTALKRWKPIEVELLNYRKDGQPFWVELSIVPVADEKGWFTHWVSVQRDVSERKANEENAMRFRLAEAHNQQLASEVQERKRVEAELAFAAFHDHLTGLRNRAYFMDKLQSSMERATDRALFQTGLIFLDLDSFKLVNDSLGHSAGDLLLVEVASRLKACSRPQDTLARIGGDEFTILCEDLSSAGEFLSIAERILQALQTPVALMDMEVSANASIGLCLGQYTDSEHMLRDADVAMYRAKREGGARYALFDDEMHENAKAALRTRLELRSAIENGELEVFYQPLIDALTQEIQAVEALVRWRHPERGLVPPLEFIGIAEETGLIIDLGLWVLREVCRHFALWRDAAAVGPDFRVNVNVSSRQLEDTDFYAELEGALAAFGMNPAQLELEITESVFLKNADRMGALFNRIRSLGVRIAFDDFGTGYSSLSYLERYPIDTLKIDQSFVKRLMTGQTNADIVRMIVGLAHALGVSVSAEGVEERRQRDALLEYGCTQVQGYLYSRPVPFADISRLLTSPHAELPWYEVLSLPLQEV